MYTRIETFKWPRLVPLSSYVALEAAMYPVAVLQSYCFRCNHPPGWTPYSSAGGTESLSYEGVSGGYCVHRRNQGGEGFCGSSSRARLYGRYNKPAITDQYATESGREHDG